MEFSTIMVHTYVIMNFQTPNLLACVNNKLTIVCAGVPEAYKIL